jgi:hypothetical protein
VKIKEELEEEEEEEKYNVMDPFSSISNCDEDPLAR